LVTGFIEVLHNVTTSNTANPYSLQFTTARIKTSHSSVSSPAVAWYRLLTADVHLTLGSRAISVPQLPASKSNSSQQLNCSSPMTDCSPVHFTPLYSTARNSLIVLLIISKHGPQRKHHCYEPVAQQPALFTESPLNNGSTCYKHYNSQKIFSDIIKVYSAGDAKYHTRIVIM
jgi:hypothetical protein